MYKEICCLLKKIDEYNLTNGGTIDGNLTVTQCIDASCIDVSNIVIHNEENSVLFNNSYQTSNIFSEIITVLDISSLTFVTSSVDVSQVAFLDTSTYSNGIVYSNSDVSENIYKNDIDGLCIDVSGNRTKFYNSFIELYLTTNITSSGNNNQINGFFVLDGIETSNRFVIDTRGFNISRPLTVAATFGPVCFFTQTDGILTDKYRLLAVFKNTNQVVFD